MLDRKLASTESGKQVDLDLRNEVVLVSLEPLVRLLLDHDNHVPRRNTRRLIALSRELNRLPSLHALVDMHLQHLLLRNDLARITSLALVFMVDDLSRTRAFVARRLELLDHRAHLAKRNLDTATMADMT